MAATSAIVAALRRLQDAPLLHQDAQSRWLALLEGQLIPVADVRAVLEGDPSLRDELERRCVPLEWLANHDPEPGREDLAADAAHLDRQLDELEQRARSVAGAVAGEFIKAAQAQGLCLPDRDPEHTTERVWRVLGGLVQAIRGGLPRPLRWRGEAVFRIVRAGDDELLGYWEREDEEPEVVDMLALAVHRADLVGGFPVEAGVVLADLILWGLFLGHSVLPGLSLLEASKNYVRLSWRSPALPDRLHRDPVDFRQPRPGYGGLTAGHA